MCRNNKNYIKIKYLHGPNTIVPCNFSTDYSFLFSEEIWGWTLRNSFYSLALVWWHLARFFSSCLFCSSPASKTDYPWKFFSSLLFPCYLLSHAPSSIKLIERAGAGDYLRHLLAVSSHHQHLTVVWSHLKAASHDRRMLVMASRNQQKLEVIISTSSFYQLNWRRRMLHFCRRKLSAQASQDSISLLPFHWKKL